MDETGERILTAAKALFMRLGIRSVTMDDVARELSVSKKTLYQYFKNKDELVTQVMNSHLDKETSEYDEIHEVAENAIDEIFKISQCMRKNISNMNPATLNDVRKYHQSAWKFFEDFKQGYIRERITTNIEQGIAEGFYRDSLDPEIMAVFRLEQVQLMFDTSIFPPDKFDFSKVQLQLLDHFVHGLLTDKGREQYLKFQKEEAKIINQ